MRRPLGAATIVLLGALGALAACSKTPEYRPAVDMAGRTETDYNYDLLYCHEAARQVDVASGVVVGAVAGAVLGPAVGAASGAGAGTGASIGVPAGAIAGGSAASGYDRITGAQYRNPIDQCMEQRGWTLLEPSPTNASQPPADLTQPDAKGSGSAAAPTTSP